MTRFPDNCFRPDIIPSALVLHEDFIVVVKDQTEDSLLVIKPDNTEVWTQRWHPIYLDDNWVKKSNLEFGSKIKNVRTGVDWILKKFGNFYYITVIHDLSLGENPMIPAHYVHDLQDWYLRLTEKYLPISET